MMKEIKNPPFEPHPVGKNEKSNALKTFMIRLVFAIFVAVVLYGFFQG